MSLYAVEVTDLWKKYRIFHEKNQYLKSTILNWRKSRYDEFWALRDLSFEVPAGSTFGVIGPNGSGKSTLLKVLAGILSADRGTFEKSGRLTALLELGAGFHPDLTGRENIYLNGAILGATRREIDLLLSEIIDFSGIGSFIDTAVKNYSSGMTVRLGFSIAVSMDPDILVVDEVLAVGDETFQQQCYEKIEEFKRQGRTIIFVSHGLSQVTQLCESAMWLDRGQIKEIGPSYSVVNNYTADSHHAIAEIDDIGTRWGTGEIQIDQVSIVNSRSDSTFNLMSGEPCQIRIEFTSSTDVGEIVVGIRVSHLHGLRIWGTNTKRHGLNMRPKVGCHCVILEIPSLNFLEGTFDLTVAISDSTESRHYDYWDRKVRFRVAPGDFRDEGLILQPSSWRIES